ncbi:MAG: glutamine-hydrolyzing carbamoyl-phosphate synthase small subunit [Actinomycetales bacterium]
MSRSATAVLVLEDGLVMHGRQYGAVGQGFGEAVFSTGMTGYQETLTDPSYCRQVVVMTAPHVGNTGVNEEDAESRRIWVAGYVVRDPARIPSSWRATASLDARLELEGIVGISEVDTRALTRHLRERGAMRAGIFSGPGADGSTADLLDLVRASPGMIGADLTAEVTTAQPYLVRAIGPARCRVVAVDLGIKAMTPHRMAERGMDVHVVPAGWDVAQILELDPHGVFFSNGPGDPATAARAIATVGSLLDRGVPVFGICFGHQVLGRALGLDTYKLRYGHRGINQPVQDRRSGKVAITAHNHGFAVQAPLDGPFPTPFGQAEVSHLCLNDGVVEGLRCLDVPAFSVQYHPEAAAGPHDAAYLFDEFADLMSVRRQEVC